MTETVLLYTTSPDIETAQRIARALVESRLAACANILPGMQAIYRWRGAIETDSEVVAIFKTTAALAPAARNLILQQHPYETPCVVCLPIDEAGSSPAYLAWIEAETGPQ